MTHDIIVCVVDLVACCLEANNPRKHIKLETGVMTQVQSSSRSCTIAFDGASKGNPGQAGAGVVLRADDGRMICKLREGLGIATCNAAEYRALILGMKYALMKGFTNIRVLGDSKLVCMQIQGLWKVRHLNMSDLYEEAKKLKDRFLSFEISHVLRANHLSGSTILKGDVQGLQYMETHPNNLGNPVPEAYEEVL
ncbi:hypothetical protein Vadar_019961 [Vaccinium darrowii]|uniref:Uncharacterized protein n=1 Tax=Vaccinium darrowii TaxID=229202 RepID=A0ACB7X2B0_9ERIC|nr:hypothetical protein Vadar_019961 [Vaccinium darrowii]